MHHQCIAVQCKNASYSNHTGEAAMTTVLLVLIVLLVLSGWYGVSAYPGAGAPYIVAIIIVVMLVCYVIGQGRVGAY
jgi:apolipoprotein N-acyltransferase